MLFAVDSAGPARTRRDNHAVGRYSSPRVSYATEGLLREIDVRDRVTLKFRPDVRGLGLICSINTAERYRAKPGRVRHLGRNRKLTAAAASPEPRWG